MGRTAALALDTDELPAFVPGNRSAIVPTMDAKSDTRYGDASDRELAGLLKAIASNDHTAFEAFYDATSERALSLVLRITQRMEIAEEVVSDVYLQIWRQADQFDPSRGNAFAWLTIICRSRALDTLRKNNTSPTIDAEPITDIHELESSDFPQDLLLAVERSSAIHDALSKLESHQRQLLALAYFRGYSHSELAQFTGMPLGTVKTQLRRTLMKLKELMIGSDYQERASA